jgi:hypothetical protein
MDIPWRAIPKYQLVILSSFFALLLLLFAPLVFVLTFRRFREKSMRRQTFERYNIEACVSRKEEIPICFEFFMVSGAGNNRLCGSFSRLYACL